MPLTREQSSYIKTGGTVFLPSVAIDNSLGVRGTSVFDNLVTVNNNLTVNGNLSILNRITTDVNGSIKYSGQVAEAVTLSLTAANTTVTYDVMTNKNVLYYTLNATADWTFNIRGNSNTTLNSLMDVGQSLTVVFMNTNGATAYRATALQIDEASVTPKWFGGTAPTAGNANSIDLYTYNVIKTAPSTYTVLASQTKFA